MESVGDRDTAAAQIIDSEESAAALRAHLQGIVEGEAFRSSRRCRDFLTYVVEHAIAGHFESLKERVIGLELFERSASYDTKEDAIVRVTASDVRKRLLQHYGRAGFDSPFRISLPLGSYIPEIVRTPPGEGHRHPEASDASEASSAASPTDRDGHSGQPVPYDTPGTPARASQPETGFLTSRSGRWWLALAVSVIVLNMALWAIAWKHFSSKVAGAPIPLAPWSSFFASPRPTHLVASDPDIEAIQIITDAPISLSDYANHRYLPDTSQIPAMVREICRDMLHGDKASSIDMEIAVAVADLARTYAKRIDVIGARDLQLSNLKTDDNFIFLGSPLSNPWVATFNDQLDFRFIPDPASPHQFSGSEVIRNFRPRQGEPAVYAPTAKGGATGESFAMIALVANPDQNGQVLLLAGADREGTQAAGRLVTDLPRFAESLRACGISPSLPAQHFEMLLRVNTMAGFPTQTAVAACHLLPGAAGRQ